MVCLITLGEDTKEKIKGKDNPLISAVQMLGDGISQVPSFENQTATNILSFLNIEPEELDSNGHSSAKDEMYNEIENQENICDGLLDQTSSVRSFGGTT